MFQWRWFGHAAAPTDFGEKGFGRGIAMQNVILAAAPHSQRIERRFWHDWASAPLVDWRHNQSDFLGNVSCTSNLKYLPQRKLARLLPFSAREKMQYLSFCISGAACHTNRRAEGW